MTNNAGEFVWYELLTEDPEAAQGFYTKVIGWGIQPWEGGSEPYVMWTANDEPIGGVMKLPDEAKQAGAPSHWTGYIGVKDVKTTVAAARTLGAQVLVPTTEIPTVGVFSVIADPQGASIAVYTPAEESAPMSTEMQPGRVAWHELMTTDQSVAWDFYQQLFGWEKTESMDMGEQGIYQMYGKHGRTFGGFMTKPPSSPGQPSWLFYITVENLDAALKRVTANGGNILNGPMEVPGGDRVAQCIDPQGAAFALHGTAN